MLKAIIIDDEQQSRIALQQEIKFNCPQVEIVAEANSVASGVKAIKGYQPDLVFSRYSTNRRRWV